MKRIIFWLIFVVILGLIVWGLVVAMNKPPSTGLTSDTPTPVTLDDHVRGPDDALVTLIEYSDFQCPACAAYFQVVEKLLNESSTSVRFVYRHFPLFPLPHKNAFIASQASVAAGKQGKFWDMYSKLFEMQTEWENSNSAAELFEGYAKQIGLNVDTYKKDFDSTEVKARVQRDRDEGDTLGIAGTPTFFVNGKAVVNPQGYDEFKKLIDEAAQAAAN